jgi:hypothetical protein
MWRLENESEISKIINENQSSIMKSYVNINNQHQYGWLAHAEEKAESGWRKKAKYRRRHEINGNTIMSSVIIKKAAKAGVMAYHESGGENEEAISKAKAVKRRLASAGEEKRESGVMYRKSAYRNEENNIKLSANG